MATSHRQAPPITLVPALARIVSGTFGTDRMFQRPILRIIKVQGISMIAGPRKNPEDETEPQEGDTLFAYRLFLTDDEYVVGAVLDPVLHPLVHDKVLTGPGTYVRLTDYDVRTSPKRLATDKFTRFLKVRGLDVVYSPGIEFHPESTDGDGDSVMGGANRTVGRLVETKITKQEAGGAEQQEDEMVVIKQEAASSQHQADIGLDGTRDREIDDRDDEYGLDVDEEEDLFQLERQDEQSSAKTHNTTPDSFATADETPHSPDYMLDDLDEVTEEDILLLSQSSPPVEPKTVVKREAVHSTWKSTQKQKMPEEKLRLGGGLKDITSTTDGGSCQQRAGKDSQPLFYEKENERELGGSPLKPSSSKSPTGGPQKSLQSAPPRPQQDRGLSPGPSTGQRAFPIWSNSPAPGTPKKPLKPFTIFSSPRPTPSQQRPIVITKLGELFDRPLKSKVDVLAVIAKIDDNTITRSIGIKRDMHLLDPTVERTVWLSVWVDAATFKPPVGSCVLFRGLTVHKFDGRSLNAFQEVAGTQWSVVEPTEENVPGVDELKEWWRRKTVEEALKSFGEDEDF